MTQLLLSVILTLLLVGNCAGAEESLTSIMQRMQSAGPVSIDYQERRQLEFMAEPWQGSGTIYSLPPDLMIRQQLEPERLLMGIKGNAMLYFDPANSVRHQSEMDEENPLTLNIAVFKALTHADETLLQRLYHVDLLSRPQGWRMTLKPKQNGESGFKIVITGLPQQQASKVIIYQPDGDYSEMTLQKATTDDALQATMNRLYQELVGE